MKQVGRNQTLIPIKLKGRIKAITIERLINAGYLPIMTSNVTCK